MSELSALGVFAILQVKALWAALGLATAPLVVQVLVLVVAVLAIASALAGMVCLGYLAIKGIRARLGAVAPDNSAPAPGVPANAQNNQTPPPPPEALSPQAVQQAAEQAAQEEARREELESELEQWEKECSTLAAAAAVVDKKWTQICAQATQAGEAASERAKAEAVPEIADAQSELASKKETLESLQNNQGPGQIAAQRRVAAAQEKLEGLQSAQEQNAEKQFGIAFEAIVKEKDPDGAIERAYYTSIINFSTLQMQIINRKKALRLPQETAPREEQQLFRDCYQAKKRAEQELNKMPPLPAEPGDNNEPRGRI